MNPELLANASQLSTGLTGQTGDGSNLQRLLNALSAPVLASGSQTLEQYYAGIVGSIGSQVQMATSQQSAQQTLGQQLQTQQQSISGVDENSQLLQMLNFQQAFQLGSSYISAVNTAYDALYNITL